MYRNTLPASALKIASSISSFSSLTHALGPPSLPMVQPPPPPPVPTPIATSAPSFAPLLQSTDLLDNPPPINNFALTAKGLDQTPRALLMMSGVHASDPFMSLVPEEDALHNLQLPFQPSFPTSNEAPTHIQTLSGYQETPYPFLPSFPISPIPPTPPFTLNFDSPLNPVSPFAMPPISKAARLGGFSGPTQHSGLLTNSSFELAYGAGYGSDDGVEDTSVPNQRYYSSPLPIALPTLPAINRSAAYRDDTGPFESPSSTLDGILTVAVADPHPQRVMGVFDTQDPFRDEQRPMGSVARTPGTRRARRVNPYPTDYQTQDGRGHPLAPTGATTQHQASNPRKRVAPIFITFGPSHDAGQMAGSSTSAVEQPTMQVPERSSRSTCKVWNPNVPGSAGWALTSVRVQEENPLKGLTTDDLKREPEQPFANESPETLARTIAEAQAKSSLSKGKSSNRSARPSSSTGPPPPCPEGNLNPSAPPRKPCKSRRSTGPARQAPPYQSGYTAPVEDEPSKVRDYAKHAGANPDMETEVALQRKEERKQKYAAAREERMRRAEEAKKASTKKDGAKTARTKKADVREI